MPRALSTNQIEGYQCIGNCPLKKKSSLKFKFQCLLTLLHGLAPGEEAADDPPPTQISVKKKVALDILVG